jgi:predicted Zn-dependent protease
MAGFAREALERWQEANPAVRFALQADTTGAQITIRWIDRFGIDRTGQTDLTWNQRGVIQHASIYLAVNDPLGRPVPDQGLRTVALHEVGHAIGLPHSGEPDDLMFPATHAAQPTARDLRTAQLLYQLPPGDIRDR